MERVKACESPDARDFLALEATSKAISSFKDLKHMGVKSDGSPPPLVSLRISAVFFPEFY